jgi:hypothetical protein
MSIIPGLGRRRWEIIELYKDNIGNPASSKTKENKTKQK